MSPESAGRHIHMRLTQRELTRYRSFGLIVDEDPGAVETERRVRRIRRMHRDLGLSYDVIALIVPLVERLEELEARAVELPAVRIRER